ncbi:hypothetical protein [Sphingomonas sp.]|uniref:hypothetical protein n=1 Tax=Sphingomonas sp. TaxID=28214 RepID=UPI003CC54378
MKRLIALALSLVPASAFAACPAANNYSFAFANQAAATLAYGGSYNYTAATSGGASRGFTMAVAQNGLTSTQVNTTQLPAIGTLITGADASKRDLVLGGTFAGRTTSMTSGGRVVTVTFTFAQPIRDFAATLHDIDFSANQYRDWVAVTGANGGTTYTPVLSASWGNGNGAGVPRTASGSSVTFGPGSAPITLAANEGVGTGASGNNSDDGIISAAFAQPVTTVTIVYGNAPYTSGESTTGQQAIGLAGISFCPMPDVTVAKTSAPIAGTYGAFNLPGSDIAYTLTVTNNGGSPVDASSIVLTDVLPAAVEFRNTTLDASTGAPFSIVSGSSGVTLTSTSPAYSSDGGATWAYAPATGYDNRVKAVRITPSGQMAANSSFSINFVARVK